MANFVRRFVKDYSDLTAPLVELTRKSCQKRASFKKAWGPAQDAAFQKLKDVLSSAPVLQFLHFSREFVVHTDASELGVGVFLAQPSKGSTDDRELDIIAYYSKRFSSNQGHYSPTTKVLRVSCCCLGPDPLASIPLGSALHVPHRPSGPNVSALYARYLQHAHPLGHLSKIATLLSNTIQGNLMWSRIRCLVFLVRSMENLSRPSPNSRQSVEMSPTISHSIPPTHVNTNCPLAILTRSSLSRTIVNYLLALCLSSLSLMLQSCLIIISRNFASTSTTWPTPIRPVSRTTSPNQA